MKLYLLTEEIIDHYLNFGGLADLVQVLKTAEIDEDARDDAEDAVTDLDNDVTIYGIGIGRDRPKKAKKVTPL